MKRAALLLTLGLLAAAPRAAEKAGAVELPEAYEPYFEDVQRDKDLLRVKAKPAYSELAGDRQEATVAKLMRKLDKDLKGLEGPLLFQIEDGGRGSLWIYPEKARQPYKFEDWDKTRETLTVRSPLGRWFGYIGLGAALGFPKEFDGMTFGANLGVKVGTMLYKDLLDFGLSLSGSYNFGFSAYAWDSGTGSSIGAFSRLHFPLFSTLRGNVGGDATYASTSTYSETIDIGTSKAGSTAGKRTIDTYRSETAALLGLSYYLPFGSLDLDARFATVNTYSLGITTFFSAAASSTPKPSKKAPRRRSTQDED